MLYQPLLSGEMPFVARCGGFGSFELHFHHEIEILYAVEGSFEMTLNGQKFTVDEGEFVFIGSMRPHEMLSGGSGRRLLLEIGPLFLREYFGELSMCTFENPVIPAKSNEFGPILDDTARCCGGRASYAELAVIGNLYRLCALLMAAARQERGAGRQAPGETFKIEKALELIYHHYKEPVTVEEAARLTGYGKSNFCKIFKNTAGMSFHAYLNSFRVKNAGYLLAETTASVEDVGLQVGFADAKTFCRVFRSLTGMTPGQFRREGGRGG